MLLTCRSTVRSLRNSSAAIDRLVWPAATRRSTCSSRPVSPPAALAVCLVSASTRARSGPASNSRKTQPAASSSISAPSWSPSWRRASPIRTRTRAASYGTSRSCQAAHAWRSAWRAARASPSPSSTAPLAWAATASSAEWPWPLGGGADRLQQRRAEVVGDLGQLIGRGVGRLAVAGGVHDLDMGGEQLGPRHAVRRLVHHPADRRRRDVDLSLGQPQQGQAGLRVPAQLAGPTGARLGLRELA